MPDVVIAPQAEAKPSPCITLDGEAVQFLPGESVIQAAVRRQVEIPHYCWHPRLSVAANCRMCLVEVEKAPKLVPACQTECKEGMVVHTKNARVKVAQRQVHEFLLVNHPIDCPICDQAGECKLQDYYMRYQLAPSRMREPKVYKPKLTRLGPHVVYNAQRCIMCTRCVRFMDEVAQERQLGVMNRGDHSEIGTFPGQPLDNPYALNTVDVCPVGALTSTVFRFKQRVWNLQRTPSICPGCAKGCNVQVDARGGQVYRMLPRENEAVNRSWMCDDGRLTYNRANDARLTEALVQDAPFLRATTGAEAIGELTRRLAPHWANSGRWALALDMHASCEEAHALRALVDAALPEAKLYALGHEQGEADNILRHADKNPNRRGVMRVLGHGGRAVGGGSELGKALLGGEIDVLFVLGAEHGQAAILAERARGVATVVNVAASQGAWAKVAHVTLPAPTWVQNEGSWLSGEERLQRLVPAFAPSGEARPLLAWLAALAELAQVAERVPARVTAHQLALTEPGAAFAGVDYAALDLHGLDLAAPAAAAKSA